MTLKKAMKRAPLKRNCFEATILKRRAFCQLMMEISYFKAQQTKISYNIVFFGMYRSKVRGGVNTRFGKMTQA